MSVEENKVAYYNNMLYDIILARRDLSKVEKNDMYTVLKKHVKTDEEKKYEIEWKNITKNMTTEEIFNLNS